MSSFYRLTEELGIEPDLVFKFVLVYSRFEYALKKTQRYRSTTRNEKASAEILQFGDDHDEQFRNESGNDDLLEEAIEYLDSNPPGKQVVRGGQLEWDEIEWSEDDGESRLHWLLRSVQTARNNLFHGGKFRDGPVEDPSRDPRLLKYGIILVRFCVGLNEEVEEYYKRTLDAGRVEFPLPEIDISDAY